MIALTLGTVFSYRNLLFWWQYSVLHRPWYSVPRLKSAEINLDTLYRGRHGTVYHGRRGTVYQSWCGSVYHGPCGTVYHGQFQPRYTLARPIRSPRILGLLILSVPRLKSALVHCTTSAAVHCTAANISHQNKWFLWLYYTLMWSTCYTCYIVMLCKGDQ